ncbi:MAG: hypothetical protein K9G59_03835 [Caulobacter sp.]|nr:hypothetical protein [Caulobacter sp.]
MTNIDPHNPPHHDTRSAGPRGGNSTPWVVAAVVAVVAIIAVAFMVTSQTPPETDAAAIAQAQDLGRAEGALAGAQSTLNAAENAARSAAAQTSADAAQAAADAREAADRAAASADAAIASDAARMEAPPPPEQPMQ